MPDVGPARPPVLSQDDYQRIIAELQDFLIELNDLKKKRAQSYLFSILQTLFLLFCSTMFFVLQIKIEFIKEIIFLPLYCIAIKDSIFHVKETQTLRKFEKEFKGFISKAVIESSL